MKCRIEVAELTIKFKSSNLRDTVVFLRFESQGKMFSRDASQRLA